jgi:hypothetical protein
MMDFQDLKTLSGKYPNFALYKYVPEKIHTCVGKGSCDAHVFDVIFEGKSSTNGRVKVLNTIKTDSDEEVSCIVKCALSLQADLLHRDYVAQMIIQNSQNISDSDKAAFMKCLGEFFAPAVFDDQPSAPQPKYKITHKYQEPERIMGVNLQNYFVVSQIDHEQNTIIPCLVSIAFQKITSLATMTNAIVDVNKLYSVMGELNELFKKMYRVHIATGFVHNDLHGSNIVFDHNDQMFKVIDYGRAHMNINDEWKSSILDYISEVFGMTWLYSKMKPQYYHKHHSNYHKQDEHGFWADLGGLTLWIALRFGMNPKLSNNLSTFDNIVSSIMPPQDADKVANPMKYSMDFVLNHIKNLNARPKLMFGSHHENSLFYYSGVPWLEHWSILTKGGNKSGRKGGATAMCSVNESQELNHNDSLSLFKECHAPNTQSSMLNMSVAVKRRVWFKVDKSFPTSSPYPMRPELPQEVGLHHTEVRQLPPINEAKAYFEHVAQAHMQVPVFVGGARKVKVKVLGRERIVKIVGKKQMITYKGELLLLKEAIKMERSKK